VSSNILKELKMFICPTCKRKFEKEENLTKHFLICWREQHPFHKSKEAPREEDIETREVNEDILNFFNSFKG
jgi:hypothetical protein